ncbi:MAG: hypothetical protein HC916_07830 [Coleofasciculaceae cyanobacterium SM2_1_6]|nr:hypothetical protein [Coleofasciculaceae cyanobacterium SM2_1_6]
MPPNMTEAVADSIIAAAGGQRVLPTDPPNICPDPGVEGRKLIFINEEGGSVGVTMAARNTLIDQAILIRGLLDGLGGPRVTCVLLRGEYFPNVLDELRPAGIVAAPGASSRPVATAGKQHFYSGVMNYRSDAIFAEPYLVPFKIATSSLVDAAPTLYATILNTYDVVPQTAVPCSGTNPRRSRRYIVQSQVTEPTGVVSQTAEIPIAISNPVAILAAGIDIASLPSTQCLAYRGESNDRFHKLLP